MTPEARKAARKAAREEAARKLERVKARLDGKEPPKPERLSDPDPEAVDEATAEAAEAGGSLSPMGSEEAFIAARRSLLEVSTPKERSAKAEALARAAQLVQGFTFERDELGLPPHFPIRPVGKKGSMMYFLDPNDEFVGLSANKLNMQGELNCMIGTAMGVVWAYYAQMSTQGGLKIQYSDLGRDLAVACSRMVQRHGLFDEMRKRRGRGAWKTESGVLVLHLGDRLIVGGEEQPLGLVEGLIYARDLGLTPPAAADAAFSTPLAAKLFGEDGERPAAKDVTTEPGRWLLEAFKTWRWKRPGLDPWLVLGYVVCVLMGAAIDWRPSIYPIGDAASGKSSLVALIKAVLGDRLLDLADPSGPGIYQTLGLAAIGVWADEFEAEGDQAHDARAHTVLKLARYAADGKNLVRGGADGVPTNYQARGTFAFTGINPPGLKPAEVSRMAMPMLDAFPEVKPGEEAPAPPALTSAEGVEMGAWMLRRIVERWHEWPDVLTAWRGALRTHGHDSRACDTFGALLAAAHLVLKDGPPLAKDIEAFSAELPRSTLRETSARRANWERCLDWLLQGQPDSWRGLRYRSIGEYLQAFHDDVPKEDADETSPHAARTRLAQAGLGLTVPREGPLEGRTCLAVPTNHREVARLFEGQPWAMATGAERGGWAYALAFAPADMAEESKARVDGRSVRCILLALDKIISPPEPGDVANGRIAPLIQRQRKAPPPEETPLDPEG